MQTLNRRERAQWRCHTRVEKFEDNVHYARFLQSLGRVKPLEVLEVDGNLLLNAGITLLWGLVAGSVTPAMATGHCRLAVGDNSTSTAAAASQTDLQAASNKQYHGTGTTVSLNTSTPKGLQVVATFGSTDANFAWNEWGVVYDSASTTGSDVTSLPGTATMINRKVESLGTKSGGSWTMTVTLSLS